VTVDSFVANARLVIDEDVAKDLLGALGLPQLVLHKVPSCLGNAGAVCTVRHTVECKGLCLFRPITPEASVTAQLTADGGLVAVEKIRNRTLVMIGFGKDGNADSVRLG
jgi:hypothetical protein